jgi:hypothetical protein
VIPDLVVFWVGPSQGGRKFQIFLNELRSKIGQVGFWSERRSFGGGQGCEALSSEPPCGVVGGIEA